MTHNSAILIRLLKDANDWVGLPDLMRHTKEHCKSECYPVHSRIADLRGKYGYTIYNDTKNINGVNHSFYMIKVTDRELRVLRKIYNSSSRFMPSYSQVLRQLMPEQKVLI